MIGWIIPAVFQLCFMALDIDAIDIINRRGPSNKMRHHLQTKKTKVRLYYPLIEQQKMF